MNPRNHRERVPKSCFERARLHILVKGPSQRAKSVSGHDFSRAERPPIENLGLSPCAVLCAHRSCSDLRHQAVQSCRIRRSHRLPGLILRNLAFLIAASVIVACGGNSLTAQAPAAPPHSRAEVRTCTGCHAPEAKGFAENPHAQPSAMGCSGCHGLGKAHIESGGAKADMFDPATAPVGETNAICLACHRGRHASFENSVHGKSGLSCMDCHRIHGSGAGKALLKAAQPGLCYRCHAEVKPQFSLPFRHNIDRGPVECSDCHDPHGSTEDRLASATRQDTICTNCHTAMAGPFVFEHAALKAEGCTACHVSHGGKNPHLLIRADIDGICQQCHLPRPDPATGAHVKPAGSLADSRPCTGCHEDMHGSNLSPVFLGNQ